MILAAAAGFLAGAGGQALYMISAFEKNPAMDMVLLLDGSGSMEDEKEGCDKAARALLDQMDENSRAQVVSFAATVLGNTDLLPMDETGKDTVTDFIRSIDVIGGTEFGQPLTFALNSLRENKEEQRAQAVILLSDGEGSASGFSEGRIHKRRSAALYAPHRYRCKTDGRYGKTD